MAGVGGDDVSAELDAACRAELERFGSTADAPVLERVCVWTVAWSEHCPRCVTPATARWLTETRARRGAVERPAPNGNASPSGNSAALKNPQYTKTAQQHRHATPVDRVLAHLQAVGDLLVSSGRVQSLYGVLGSSEMVKYQLLLSGQQKDGGGPVEAAQKLVQRLRTVLYVSHTQHLTVQVLADPSSQDWSDHNTPEDGTCSVSIQYWWMYVQGLYYDLKEHLSPSLARQLFSEVFVFSLGQLVIHYGSVTVVSPDREQQFRMDAVAILLCVSEMMHTMVLMPEQLFDDVSDTCLETVAAQCRTLLLTLGHLTAPLKLIAHNFSGGFPRLAPVGCWLSLVRPSLIPDSATGTSELDTGVFVYLHVRALVVQFPSLSCWPLLVRALMGRDFALPVLIMAHLTERSLTGSSSSTSRPLKVSGCGMAQCSRAECAAGTPSTDQYLFSSLVLLVTRAAATSEALSTVLAPCLRRQRESGSTVCPEAWTSRRPLWLQALVELVRPAVDSTVASLVEDIERKPPQPTSTLVVCLLQYVMELLDDLPCALLQFVRQHSLAELPMGLGVHVVICGVYDALNDERSVRRLASAGCQQAVYDVTVAVGERLCRPDDIIREQLTHLRESLLTANLEQPLAVDLTRPQLVLRRCTVLAARVCCDQAGQRAMWVVAQVLRQNVSWLRQRLGVARVLPASDGPEPPCSAAAANLALPQLSEDRVFWPQAAIGSIGDSRLDGALLAAFQLPYERLLSADLGQSEPWCRDLVSRRCDMQPDSTLSETVAELAAGLRRVLELT